MSAAPSSELQYLLTAREGAVLTITLNRPQALNSFLLAMHGELMGMLNAAAQDASVRAVVLTGAGRGFCAGQDLADPAMGPGQDVGDVVQRYYKPLALRLQSMPVPVVAAVNGVAAGAGANLALNCDVVVAAKSASFIQAFSKIGLVPDCGGTWLLPRLVGRANALALTLTGDKLSAEEAQRMGLIHRCVEDAELAATAHSLANKLAAMPVKALAATRQLINEAMTVDYATALQMEARVQGQLARAHDFAEGVQAFKDKRQAVFKDR